MIGMIERHGEEEDICSGKEYVADCFIQPECNFDLFTGIERVLIKETGKGRALLLGTVLLIHEYSREDISLGYCASPIKRDKFAVNKNIRLNYSPNSRANGNLNKK